MWLLMRKAQLRYFSSIEAQTVEWLWYPYIPFGRITIIQGDPGEGKTTLVLNIAARLSRGEAMPESQIAHKPCSVIYQSTEDGLADTIKPRLVHSEADCDRIAFIDDQSHPLKLDDERLEQAINQTSARMMVLDPLQAFIGANADMHRANEMRPLMQKLAGIAERTQCAIVIIGHMNKASGTKGLYRSLGSIDITAAARSVLLVGRLAESPNIRAMTQIKNNLAQEGRAVAFELADEGRVRWIGYYDVTADDLLSGGVCAEDSKLEQARRLLKDTLVDGDCSCTEMYALCRQQGISARTVETAKRLEGVRSIRTAGIWYWRV